MSRRARMLRLDKRTGRLERAVHLYEDGEKPGLWTREPDRPHPQSIKIVPGLDRGSIKQTIKVYDKGVFNFLCGYVAGHDLLRVNDFPALTFGWTFGSFDWDVVTGYSHWGYGAQGYGGFGDDPQTDNRWSG